MEAQTEFAESGVTAPALEGWLTLPEIAERWGMTRAAVAKRIKAGAFPEDAIRSVGVKQPQLIVRKEAVERAYLDTRRGKREESRGE